MVARRLEDIRMLVDRPIVFNQVNALGIRISLANLLIEKDQFVATDFAPLTKQDASRDGIYDRGHPGFGVGTWLVVALLPFTSSLEGVVQVGASVISELVLKKQDDLTRLGEGLLVSRPNALPFGR